MQFVITFLEGIISFISPCMLPMLPVYISYFAGGADKKGRTFVRALAFMLGFTAVFTALGLFAGSLGAFLIRYNTAVNIISGVIIIIFGLSCLDIIRIPWLNGFHKDVKVTGVFSAFLFGVVYSVSHMPCVGVFLGSALTMATSSGAALEGGLLLLVYSLGLGVPFVLSALLIEKLRGAFDFIKRHYRVINIICGCFLIVIGILMAAGVMHKLTHLLG